MSKLEDIARRLLYGVADLRQPWSTGMATPHGSSTSWDAVFTSCRSDDPIAYCNYGSLSANFFANAPTDISYLLAIAQAAERLMKETTPCWVCRGKIDPCCDECAAERTVRQALEGSS